MARPRTSPWRRMKVGETVLVRNRTSASLKGCWSHLKPRKFSTRNVHFADGTRGVRVWRIA